MIIDGERINTNFNNFADICFFDVGWGGDFFDFFLNFLLDRLAYFLDVFELGFFGGSGGSGGGWGLGKDEGLGENKGTEENDQGEERFGKHSLDFGSGVSDNQFLFGLGVIGVGGVDLDDVHSGFQINFGGKCSGLVGGDGIYLKRGGDNDGALRNGLTLNSYLGGLGNGFVFGRVDG